MLNNVNYDIDITKEPPADDTARQYYFIEKAKAYVQRESEELGRPLTFCVTTFGWQMYSFVYDLHPCVYLLHSIYPGLSMVEIRPPYR